MDSKKEIYEIEFTEDCRDEIREIYKYISENLVADQAAKNLMRKMRDSVNALADNPKLYRKIEKKDKVENDYRRLIINNFVILYTINEEKKIVYIAHMYYGRRNYL